MNSEGDMKDIIDIHTHILPGMDDGAKSREDAFAMARAAHENGTTTVVATPHTDLACRRPEGLAQAIRHRARALEAALASSGISVRVLPGMEIAIDPHLADLVKCGRALTIGDSGRYVLVEMPFQMIPEYAEKAVFDLSASGYVTVIAHPERCADVARDPNRMYALVRAGAIGQVNAGSLTGAFGRPTRKVAEILLRHGLAHVIASDAHSSGTRPCRLDHAFSIAEKIIGREGALRALKEIPRAIVNGDGLRLDAPERYMPGKWFLFGKMRV